MSFAEIYQIAGAGMHAQTIRLNTVASNLANAGAAAETKDTAYRSLKPVFSTIYNQTQTGKVSGAQDTDGIGSLLVKYGCPCDPGVACFPDTTRGRGDKPGTAVGRMDRNIGNTSTH